MHKSEPGDGQLRRGIYVFASLVILTILEFGVAVADLPGSLLFIIALVKVLLILVYYMHVRGVFRLDEEGF